MSLIRTLLRNKILTSSRSYVRRLFTRARCFSPSWRRKSNEHRYGKKGNVTSGRLEDRYNISSLAGPVSALPKLKVAIGRRSAEQFKLAVNHLTVSELARPVFCLAASLIPPSLPPSSGEEEEGERGGETARNRTCEGEDGEKEKFALTE